MRRIAIGGLGLTAVILGLIPFFTKSARVMSIGTGSTLHGTAFAMIVAGGLTIAMSVCGFDKTSLTMSTQKKVFWTCTAVAWIGVVLLGLSLLAV